MATYVRYMNKTLKILHNYIRNLSKYEREYYLSKKGLYNRSKYAVKKSYNIQEHELKIVEIYRTATGFYNELCDIVKRFKNGVDVEQELRNFNDKLNLARLPKFETILTLKTAGNPIDKSASDGAITGGAAGIPNFVKQRGAEYAIGKRYNEYWYNKAKNEYGPDTAGMLDLAHEDRNDLSYTKDAIELTNWNDPRVASDRDYLRKKVIKGFSYYGYNEDNVPGYFFKNYSEPSQRIANDSDFLNKIRKNKNKILSNAEDLSVSFTSKNLHNAIGLADIRNGYIDKKGNLHVKVYDTYDFNPNEDNPLVVAGRNKMLKEELKPFFTIHDIIIPKEKLKELWK